MSIAPNALLEGLYCEVAETCNRLNQAQVVLHGEAEAKYVFYPDLVNAKPVQQ